MATRLRLALALAVLTFSAGTVRAAFTPGADLAVTKSAMVSNVIVGDYSFFFIVVSNGGPDLATNIVLQESPGAGLAVSNFSVSYPNSAYVNATARWYITNLPANSTAGLGITARVLSSGPLTNTAYVLSSGTIDGVSSNNTGAAVIYAAVPQADVGVYKTADNSFVTLGQFVQFFLYATNGGPNSASNVVIQESLGPGLSFYSWANYYGDSVYDPGLSRWYITNLPPGYYATMNVSAYVTGSGTLSNAMTIINSGVQDTNTANNSAAVYLTSGSSIPSADLALFKSVVPTNGTPGDRVQFFLILTNLGPDTVSNVSVSDSLTYELSFVSSSNFPPAGTYDAFSGTWIVPQLAGGEAAYLTISAQLVATGTIYNYASISSASLSDPDYNNNYSYAYVDCTVVVPQADVGLFKSTTVSNTAPGQFVPFTITLTNAGPDEATNLVVQESPGSGMTIVGSSSTFGDNYYDFFNQRWYVTNLAVGGTAQLYLTARVDETGTLYNLASLTSSGSSDTNSLNDSSTVCFFGDHSG